VEFSLADRARMTMIELARACAEADVGPGEADGLFRELLAGTATGTQFLRAVTLTTAMALQVMRRDEPDLTMADALGWDLTVTNREPDRTAEIEADVVVAAAIVTGLPPREAGQVTTAELDAYRRQKGA
jgi:hypothetical protein